MIPRSTARAVASAASLTLTGALALALAGPAYATTVTAPDAGWTNVITNPGAGGLSVTGPYVFMSTTVVRLTVTDAFCAGDAFQVVDGVGPTATVLGSTSAVASTYPSCPFQLYPSGAARADAAWADPAYSHGTFFLAPGSHALDFRHTDHYDPSLAATGAYFRIDSVTLTKQDCKANAWRAFGDLFKNQGACLSLAS